LNARASQFRVHVNLDRSRVNTRFGFTAVLVAPGLTVQEFVKSHYTHVRLRCHGATGIYNALRFNRCSDRRRLNGHNLPIRRADRHTDTLKHVKQKVPRLP